MAGPVVQALADRGGLVPGALEILMAGQPASRWQWALVLRADLLAHQAATDSNSVSEVPAQVSNLRAAVRPKQASWKQAQQKLHAARRRERVRASSALPPQELALALAPEEEADAPATWRQPGWAREIPSAAPQAERRPALE
jgi:hypothetical protein